MDTFEGLRTLAGRARERSAAHFVAITGSVGKTGTKEMLARALAGCAATHASAGNLNNHIGVPLSLARLPQDAAYGVFEVGMNHPGEIGPLSRLLRPQTALITTIAAAHTEFFSGVDAVADAKAEIFEGLEAGGTAVLNRDNAYFDRLTAAARSAGAGRIVSFGESGQADARLLAWEPGATGGTVTAAIDGAELRYEIAYAGRHWALNSVAALACVHAAGGGGRAGSKRAPHARAGRGPGRAPPHPGRRRFLCADRRELQREPSGGSRGRRDACRDGAAHARRAENRGARRHARARRGGGALARRARRRPGSRRDRSRSSPRAR